MKQITFFVLLLGFATSLFSQPFSYTVEKLFDGVYDIQKEESGNIVAFREDVSDNNLIFFDVDGTVIEEHLTHPIKGNDFFEVTPGKFCFPSGGKLFMKSSNCSTTAICELANIGYDFGLIKMTKFVYFTYPRGVGLNQLYKIVFDPAATIATVTPTGFDINVVVGGGLNVSNSNNALFMNGWYGVDVFELDQNFNITNSYLNDQVGQSLAFMENEYRYHHIEEAGIDKLVIQNMITNDTVKIVSRGYSTNFGEDGHHYRSTEIGAFVKAGQLFPTDLIDPTKIGFTYGISNSVGIAQGILIDERSFIISADDVITGDINDASVPIVHHGQGVFKITKNETATGIVKPSTELPVDLFPNPTDGNTIISGLESGKESVINLFTSNGQRLEQQISFDSTLNIDLSTYPSGLYLVNIQQGGKQTSRKVIKQ